MVQLQDDKKIQGEHNRNSRNVSRVVQCTYHMTNNQVTNNVTHHVM